jgi:hypothetical protein
VQKKKINRKQSEMGNNKARKRENKPVTGSEEEKVVSAVFEQEVKDDDGEAESRSIEKEAFAKGVIEEHESADAATCEEKVAEAKKHRENIIATKV